MTTELEYFTNPRTGEIKPHTQQHVDNWVELQRRIDNLKNEARAAGAYHDAIDPDTGSQISGSRGGAGDGGFRADDSETGAPGSRHRKAKAEDVFDPTDELDDWLDDFEDGWGGNSMLLKHGLAREHPSKTPGWCHLQSELPASGKRTFMP